MSNIRWLGLACLAAVVVAPALARSEGVPPLERAITAYEQAQMKGNRPALEKLLADDYLLVTGGGSHETKEEFIADLTAPGFRLEPYSVQAPVRRVWPGGAIVAGVARQAGTDGGKPFDGCIRFADVWMIAGGRWQVVFTQVARISPPDAAGCKTQSR
jgi:hypothetical protein